MRFSSPLPSAEKAEWATNRSALLGEAASEFSRRIENNSIIPIIPLLLRQYILDKR
jgi:hypothetical protein